MRRQIAGYGKANDGHERIVDQAGRLQWPQEAIGLTCEEGVLDRTPLLSDRVQQASQSEEWGGGGQCQHRNSLQNVPNNQPHCLHEVGGKKKTHQDLRQHPHILHQCPCLV